MRLPLFARALLVLAAVVTSACGTPPHPVTDVSLSAVPSSTSPTSTPTSGVVGSVPANSATAGVSGAPSAAPQASAAPTTIAASSPAPVVSGNPAWHGPDPTPATAGSQVGPFQYQTVSVPGSGFLAGTIYYPTAAGVYAAVVLSPGLTAPGWTVSWYARTLASQGFVAMTIDTYSTDDSPDRRIPQIVAAVDYLANRSPLRGRIDPNRIGVMGHSAGGGAAVNSLGLHPSIKAAVLLDPVVHDDPTAAHYRTITVPTMIIVGQTDPWLYESRALYADIPNRKAYVELAGGDHNQVLRYSPELAQQAVSWLKRYLDGDTRYSRFLCPLAVTPTFSQHVGTCPT